MGTPQSLIYVSDVVRVSVGVGQNNTKHLMCQTFADILYMGFLGKQVGKDLIVPFWPARLGAYAFACLACLTRDEEGYKKNQTKQTADRWAAGHPADPDRSWKAAASPGFNSRRPGLEQSILDLNFVPWPVGSPHVI